MTQTRTTEGPWADSVVGARSAHRTLRAETAQLVRWRRLVRARLDLTVAGFAPPETLGQNTWELLPLAHAELPVPQELMAALSGRSDDDQVGLMERLRALDERLAAYGAELDAALEAATQRIEADLGAPPLGQSTWS